MTRVLLVDSHPLVIEGLERLFGRAEEIEIVGRCSSGAEALRAAAAFQPDVIVLDMRLGDLTGAEICRETASSAPLSRIVLLTAHDDIAAIRQCLDLGAAGVFLKTVASADFLDAIRLVASGKAAIDPMLVIDPMLQQRLFAGNRTDGVGIPVQLRPRETQVLRLIATGASTEAIADELGLTVNTVRTYLQTMMRKLGVNSRIQAVVTAQRHGLV